jgi:hypothetical protein
MPPIVIAKNKIKPAQSFNIYTQHPGIVQGMKHKQQSNLAAYAKDPTFASAKYYQNSVYIKDFFKSINHIRHKKLKPGPDLPKVNKDHQSTIRI